MTLSETRKILKERSSIILTTISGWAGIPNVDSIIQQKRVDYLATEVKDLLTTSTSVLEEHAMVIKVLLEDHDNLSALVKDLLSVIAAGPDYTVGMQPNSLKVVSSRLKALELFVNRKD